MATRINDLTDPAKSIAEELAARGKLKMVLSAGVIALNEMTSDEREYYYALAAGRKPSDRSVEEIFRKKVLQIIRESQLIGPKKKSSRRARSAEAG